MLFINGTIVTVDSERNIIEDGALMVQGDRIKDIGKTPHLKEKYPSEEQYDLRGKVLIPGLISTHMHLAQSLLRGTADNHVLKDWLCERIWPLESAFEEEDGYHAARLSIAEMLKSGTTTFLEALLTDQANLKGVVKAVSKVINL